MRIQLSKPVAGVLFCLGLVLIAGCNRQYAITVNNQTLYDPRGPVVGARFVDPGLQTCVSLSMQQHNIDNADNLTVLSCAGLEIRQLDGIESMSGLQFLDVAGNRLVHLDSLRSLSRLRAINASDNPLNDISALFPLPGLNSAIFTDSVGIPCAQLDRLGEKLGANLSRPLSCSS